MRRDWSEIEGVDLQPARVFTDDRGSFTKHLDLDFPASQAGTARNTAAGTVRGLHFQADPHGEVKRLWVAAGSLLDVLVDVRADSPTYGDWTAVELDADHPAVLTVPQGVAHGYQTLRDDTTVVYLITGGYVPAAARTLQWDDPALAIAWPRPVTAISDGDRAGRPWPVTF